MTKSRSAMGPASRCRVPKTSNKNTYIHYIVLLYRKLHIICDDCDTSLLAVNGVRHAVYYPIADGLCTVTAGGPIGGRSDARRLRRQRRRCAQQARRVRAVNRNCWRTGTLKLGRRLRPRRCQKCADSFQLACAQRLPALVNVLLRRHARDVVIKEDLGAPRRRNRAPAGAAAAGGGHRDCDVQGRWVELVVLGLPRIRTCTATNDGRESFQRSRTSSRVRQRIAYHRVLQWRHVPHDAPARARRVRLH